ncbi:hypothetical protein EW145_g5238 [Phellinidium pouzarii]|uniref:Uncharacterized protein n=1 Tax=Phellinidium pouzarii TaxID=167371 RepID=A0A4S4L0M0_9AGAM|nr:hypothetical protein EW145_g5238 [Phellinidium pouzarii]
MDKGFYLSGWPTTGLPTGSISIWPAYITFALAAMFIRGTITLKSLSLAPGLHRRLQHEAELVKKAALQHGKKGKPSKRAKLVKALVIKSEEPNPYLYTEVDLGLDSGSDLVNSSTAMTSKYGSKKIDTASKTPATHPGQAEEQAKSKGSSKFPSSSTSSKSNITSDFSLTWETSGASAPKDRPKQSLNSTGMPSTEKTVTSTSRAAPASSSTLFPLPSSINFAAFSDTRASLGFPLSLGAGMCTSLLPSAAMNATAGGILGKRKMQFASVPETAVTYPEIPTGATIDWVPPTSAARELKRARRG